MFGKKKNKLHFNPGNRDTGVSESYASEEVDKIDEADVEVVLNSEEDIDKKFSGSNSLSKYVQLGKIMMQMLKDTKKGNYKQVPWFTIATQAAISTTQKCRRQIQISAGRKDCVDKIASAAQDKTFVLR